MVDPVNLPNGTSLQTVHSDLSQAERSQNVLIDNKIQEALKTYLRSKFAQSENQAWSLIHGVWSPKAMQLQCGELAHSVSLAMVCNFIKSSQFKDKNELLDFLHSLAHCVHKSKEVQVRVNEFIEYLSSNDLEKNSVWIEATQSISSNRSPLSSGLSSVLDSSSRSSNIKGDLKAAINKVQDMAVRLTFKQLEQLGNLTSEQFCAHLDCGCGLKHPEVISQSTRPQVQTIAPSPAISQASQPVISEPVIQSLINTLTTSNSPASTSTPTPTIPAKPEQPINPIPEPFDDCGCGFDHNTGLPIGERIQPNQHVITTEAFCNDGSCSNPLHQHSPAETKTANRFGMVLPAMGLLGIALTYLVYDKFMNAQSKTQAGISKMPNKKTISFQAPKFVSV
jgi:hypothetical protein